MVLVILASMLCLVAGIHHARALWSSSGAVHIRANGSIDPPTAPIQRDGDNYVLTDDYNQFEGYWDTASALVIERNNMTLNGMGHRLECTASDWPNEPGIVMTGISNVTIMNMTIMNFRGCIVLSHCVNITLTGKRARYAYNRLVTLDPQLHA
jgi:hypothetical protein